jgi:hypothetical protein
MEFQEQMQHGVVEQKRNIMLSNYGIYGSVAHYNFEPVCWAYQPTQAIQEETMEW